MSNLDEICSMISGSRNFPSQDAEERHRLMREVAHLNVRVIELERREAQLLKIIENFSLSYERQEKEKITTCLQCMRSYIKTPLSDDLRCNRCATSSSGNLNKTP